LWPFGLFGLFSGHLVFLVYLVSIWSFWYILWPFGTFYGYLVCSFPFWFVVPRKIWQPCLGNGNWPLCFNADATISQKQDISGRPNKWRVSGLKKNIRSLLFSPEIFLKLPLYNPAPNSSMAGGNYLYH
jgi:hypothetical protein